LLYLAALVCCWVWRIFTCSCWWCSAKLGCFCCWFCCSCQVAIWSWSFWIVVRCCRHCFVLWCWLGQLFDWFATDCIVKCWGLINGFLVSACRFCCLLVLISLFREHIPYCVVFIWSREHVPLLAYIYMLVYLTCWFPALYHFWSIQFHTFDKKKNQSILE
jgi:hypothetical protein